MPERLLPNLQHRQAVALCGAPAWARERVRAVLSDYPAEAVLWVGAQAPEPFEPIAARRYRDYLGSDCGALVYDMHRDFHPDAFAALLGTLRGGGVLYLLLPAGDWPDRRDPALARLAPWPVPTERVGRRLFDRLRKRITAEGVFVTVGEHKPAPLPTPACPDMPVWALSAGQERVADAIRRVALGHARRPLVLTADRGRGKSTAIGAGLARLLRAHRRVVLCAPSMASVKAVFDQLQRELPEGVQTEQGFSWQQAQLYFRSPALQLEAPMACDLLVVDEAAAVGLATLQQLLLRHNRLVFSTTVHGYEGSGRGFALRFDELLRQSMPAARRFELRDPVRWRQGDPLEQWLNATLLLQAEPVRLSGAVSPRHDWVEQCHLAENESLLTQVFGLLVGAHYQTKPSDLQQLLDAPGMRLLLAMHEGAVVGVLLAVEEGGFDRALATRVCRGERRPRGHLLLQSLAQHAGWCDAPMLRALRVMRIAVQEDLRRQGIGSALLDEAARYARDNRFNLLGTSFGLEASLLPFWGQAGYRVARIGQRVDPASGAHSAQLVMGLDSAGKAFAEAVQAAFRRDLPWRLQHEFAGLSAGVLLHLLRGKPFTGLLPDRRDLENVRAFARGRRRYPDVYPSLWRWLLEHARGNGNGLDSGLLRQILQGSPGITPDRGKERELCTLVAACLAQDRSG